MDGGSQQQRQLLMAVQAQAAMINMSLNITKVAFERCIRGTPSAELTNREQTCVRDVASAYTTAQQAVNNTSG
ncbi:hypothetical protein FNF27_05784 [Cafeteria roenbergensis]|uniref:Mitochondrial import inner membrane translocase subunit n=1 Tax=Cafeteria roenbergensis TaxID=33653 RepID=A0A5A8CLM8_CAFRO|nr:hypothetical protein FNF29_03037 [Cafeteria roenbergensis]KAA0163485.1 hypothetical protein FNF31_02879 [Cafeteria roenbergensis]KAA0165926.1 hypothetical protein FNF28_03308 [Cafeteria roenbergensis]KAA0172684.1 hypothetical protein FNF27_05784 [Cafeteria roenbergensis]|eukprot:KAA0153649.1 hypothetical protein FNF29_03037 [Cafeteria roenbergensis]